LVWMPSSGGTTMRPSTDWHHLAEVSLDYWAWTQHIRDWWDLEQVCLAWTLDAIGGK